MIRPGDQRPPLPPDGVGWWDEVGDRLVVGAHPARHLESLLSHSPHFSF
jgi:hypothetical protein